MSWLATEIDPMGDSERRSVAETWTLFEADGILMPRTVTGEPFIPERMPSQGDDEPLGFSYFKSGLFDADLSNVSLPRTFFGRSDIARVTFWNSDLHQSRMCWNDFTDCDFSGANLSGCDLRFELDELQIRRRGPAQRRLKLFVVQRL